MKTSHLILLAAIVVSGLAFLFLGHSEEDLDTDTSEDTVELTQPVPGSESEVDEMIEVIDEETTQSESEPAANAQEFTLDAFKFGYSMNEMRVKEGDTVTINLTNSDGIHDWVLDEFGATTEKIQVGEETSVTFVASKKGSFEYYCSVGNHRSQGMVGTLIVE